MALYRSSIIAQGALTNSKRPSTFVEGVYPSLVKRGQGCYLYEENGKRYIDYICALGTNYFGYANPVIVDAIANQARHGTLFSLGSNAEVEFADIIKNMFHVERLKIFKTGTEGCMAAIKIARAYSGLKRRIVLSEGYHGWSDNFVGLTEPALGVSRDKYMKSLPQDLDSIAWDTVSAVILEPIIVDYSEARILWLKKLEGLCKAKNVCLIFDETITAFRFPSMTVARTYDLNPDLIIFGKALGNGMPISVVAGRAKYLDGDYFTSGSFCGELLSMASAKAGLKLAQNDFNPKYLWEMGKEFQARFNHLSPHLKMDGYPTRGVFSGDIQYKALFWQEACLAGILFGPSWFYSKALHGEMSNVLNIVESIVTRIKNGDVGFKGKLPVTPFAQKMRE